MGLGRPCRKVESIPQIDQINFPNQAISINSLLAWEGGEMDKSAIGYLEKSLENLILAMQYIPENVGKEKQKSLSVALHHLGYAVFLFSSSKKITHNESNGQDMTHLEKE